MIFDGRYWRRSRKVVTLPNEYSLGEMKNYVMFGRICKPHAVGAILTNWSIKHDDGSKEYVYALPVKCKGHFLTYGMYGLDGYEYLAYDGCCYVRKLKKKTNET